MKILFVTQYFFPEDFRGNDIAFDWAKRGDHVTVITAVPNYPEGRFFDGYGFFSKRKEMVRGVEVIRIPVIPRGNGSHLNLILNYFSFAFMSSIYALYLSLRKKFDLIFVQQLSPITLVLPALVVRKIQKIPMYLWVLDLWPESLRAVGNIHNEKILSVFEKIAKLIYKHADKILISSEGFESSIIAKGNFSHKIIHLPNWAEDVFIESESPTLLPTLPDGFIVMFAGNIGEAQDFENVLKAACVLKDEKRIKFVILGDGRKKSWMNEFCIQNDLLSTVFFLGRFPLTSMPSFFSKSDVMLISLKDVPVFGLTLPAKIQAYMASSKPIVGMMNGEGANTIKLAKCGYCVNASDYRGLATDIKKLAGMNKSELNMLGFNGKQFALKQYDKTNLLNKLYSVINPF